MIWKLRAQDYRAPKDYQHCYVATEQEEEEEEEVNEEEDDNESSSSSKAKAIHKKSNSNSKVVVTNRFVSITGAKRDRGHAKSQDSDSEES
jgi:hypothetical protein